MNLGDKLKNLRKEKNWTQPQLAETIGIEQSYLSKLENGKSIPSADVYQLILTTFKIDTEEFLDGIDHSIIHRHLRQIPEVANFLSNKQTSNHKRQLRWIVSSAFFVTMGITLLLAGKYALLFPNNQYNYFSEGIVLKGESKEIYLKNYVASNNEELQAITKKFNDRRDEEYLLNSTYQGEIFNIPVDGGSRTYQLKNEKTVERAENQLVILLGILFFTSGVFGFVVEHKSRDLKKP